MGGQLSLHLCSKTSRESLQKDIEHHHQLASSPGPIPNFQCCTLFSAYKIEKLGIGPGDEANHQYLILESHPKHN